MSLVNGRRQAFEEISQRNGAMLPFVVRCARAQFIGSYRGRQLPLDFTVTARTALTSDDERQ